MCTTCSAHQHTLVRFTDKALSAKAEHGLRSCCAGFRFAMCNSCGHPSALSSSHPNISLVTSQCDPTLQGLNIASKTQNLILAILPLLLLNLGGSHFSLLVKSLSSLDASPWMFCAVPGTWWTSLITLVATAASQEVVPLNFLENLAED